MMMHITIIIILSMIMIICYYYYCYYYYYYHYYYSYISYIHMVGLLYDPMSWLFKVTLHGIRGVIACSFLVGVRSPKSKKKSTIIVLWRSNWLQTDKSWEVIYTHSNSKPQKIEKSTHVNSHKNTDSLLFNLAFCPYIHTLASYWCHITLWLFSVANWTFTIFDR